ncbi:MAG: class I SAM-dependent RNA methyltransferase [Oscillospiraceae bacterium]|jgi:putative N6-adenine-specific DNA methylase|nr:class I SAM-dependent RNA methyltransferase [Oscillospiraceae bacterium]
MNFTCLIPCLLGLEGLIADELRGMGAQNVRAENGQVLFEGDWAVLARANLRCRYAERVQVLLGQFEACSFEALFQETKGLPWEEWIGKRDAFPVKGYSLGSTLFSVRDCQSIIKKAVAQRLTEVYHQTWHDETGPLHQIQFSIMKDQVRLTLDSSGAGLHKRGYRLQAGGAPLKETLAAALCQISKLRPYHTLYDPMCGSGSILIEGALLARNMAPGLHRNFSFERWGVCPREVLPQEREAARALAQPAPQFRAFGCDIDEAALEVARENAKRAGVADCVEFCRADMKDFAHQTARGTLITNPPYGERLLDEGQADALIGQMGKVFAPRKGWSYTVISPSEVFEATFGRKADARRKLYNGMLKCTAYMYFKN